MVYEKTLLEIQNNYNPGVEYEIALFYRLTPNDADRITIAKSIHKRTDWVDVMHIIGETDVKPILNELEKRELTLIKATFETQNDNVGPSDIVMWVVDKNNNQQHIGISVKYLNTCTLNVTGRRFITETQIQKLKKQLPIYTDKYIKEMTNQYGNVDNWFRKRKPSTITDEYIDLIRDAVIDNWGNIKDKQNLLSALFHADSPIEFWVATFTDNGYKLQTRPQTIQASRANDIVLKKYQTSYVAFYLDNVRVGHMQVKFNNGFLEKCKKQIPDIICQGIKMAYGQPFSSWNFSVEQ
jgi:hypothetical protein